MSDCIEWTGSTNGLGYGEIRLTVGFKQSVKMYVHRLAWMQDHGHTDLHILHKCDNPRCYNVDHLYAGSQQQNMRDMASRERMPGQQSQTCKNGHVWTDVGWYDYGKQRQCKACAADGQRRYRKRKALSRNVAAEGLAG